MWECVCVCAPTVYKLGSQIDFSVFCISLRYFRRIPTHMQPKSVSFFLSTCLFLLPCSQTYMLPLPFSACFPCLAWICVPPSCQIPLLFGCLDLEPNIAVNTARAKSKHHEVLDNGACCARENVRVRFQLRTAFTENTL